MVDSDEEELAFLRTIPVQITDWVVFFIMFGTTLSMSYRLMNYHGAPGTQFKLFYFGYNEPRMLSIFVCLAASVSYFARLSEHVSGDKNGAFSFVYTKYLDYIVTCPVLTLDLMWTLNLPYAITYAVFIFVVILCGLLATITPSPGKFMWFGMGLSIFSFTWFMILSKTYIRFMQLFGKRFIIPNQPRKHQSFATKHGTRDKKIRTKLTTALVCYFLVWTVYPVLWLLGEFDLIDQVVSHVCHAVCDVLAKAVYGAAMHQFVLTLDKRKVRKIFQLQVTLKDVVEAWQLNKKANRKEAMEAEKHAEEAEQEGDDDDSGAGDDDDDGDERGPGRDDLEGWGAQVPPLRDTAEGFKPSCPFPQWGAVTVAGGQQQLGAGSPVLYSLAQLPSPDAGPSGAALQPRPLPAGSYSGNSWPADAAWPLASERRGSAAQPLVQAGGAGAGVPLQSQAPAQPSSTHPDSGLRHGATGYAAGASGGSSAVFGSGRAGGGDGGDQAASAAARSRQLEGPGPVNLKVEGPGDGSSQAGGRGGGAATASEGGWGARQPEGLKHVDSMEILHRHCGHFDSEDEAKGVAVTVEPKEERRTGRPGDGVSSLSLSPEPGPRGHDNRESGWGRLGTLEAAGNGRPWAASLSP